MQRPDYIVWLETILRVHAGSQTKLAGELLVTHAALNRWLHQKAKPHPRTVGRIRELYQKCVFYTQLEDAVNVSQWRKKFLLLKQEATFEWLRHRKDFYEDCLLKLTYHTNKIEGSTLSLRQTQSILFANRVIPQHSLVEHLEVNNHRQAFGLLLDSFQNKNAIRIDWILALHRVLMNGILPDAGQFRSHPVRIVGARVVPPNYLKVPEKMEVLCEQMQATHDPIGMAMQHAWFEAIHPFTDGNGRLGRLIYNYQLLRAGFPLIIIRGERKNRYYDVLEKAQVSQVYQPLLEFTYEELQQSIR